MNITKESLYEIKEKAKATFLKYEKAFYVVGIIIAFVAYFFLNFPAALYKGGRWDLYEHIAMADRYLEGKGFYYSPTEASSPYFPGIGFLAVIIGSIFHECRDYILLIIASLIGTSFYVVLIHISSEFTKKKWLSLICVSFFMFRYFPVYKFYMNEFKGDTLVYLYCYIIILLIKRINGTNSRRIIEYVLLFFFSFLMDITKQQALYIDVALGLYILFSRNIPVHNKVYLLITMISAGILDVLILFNIKGMKLLAIDNLKNMPYFSEDVCINDIIRVNTENNILIIFCIISIIYVLCIKKSADQIFWMWLTSAIMILMAQVAGGMKIGGNLGNYEAGLVMFVAFPGIIIDRIIEYMFNKKHIYWLYLIVLAVMFSKAIDRTMLGMASTMVYFMNKPQSSSEEYLAAHYSGEKCMYDSDHYMLIERSGMIPDFDIYTVPINCKEYFDLTRNTIEKKKYDVLIINSEDLKTFDEQIYEYFGYNPHSYEALINNYRLSISDDMPEELLGRIFVK